ncbi:tyrosine-type recombinase/integrase [Bdellovibrionota bacterium FG-1]
MLNKIDVPMEYIPEVHVYYRKDCDRWYWKYPLPDGSLIQASVAKSEKEALRNAKLKEADLIRGFFTDTEMEKMQRRAGPGGHLTIDLAVDRYLEKTGFEKTGNTKNGEDAMIRTCFRKLSKLAGESNFRRLKEAHVLAFRDHLQERIAKREISAVTAQNYLKLVKKVFRWFKKRKELVSNPADEIEPIKVKPQEKARAVVFSSEEIQKLVSTAYTAKSGFNVKAFVLLMYATGMRPGELIHLEWTDVVDRWVRLRSKPRCPTKHGLGWKPKWGKDREVYLNDTALLILNSLPRVVSVGFVKGDPTPHPANFVFVTKDRKKGGLTGVPWQRVTSIRECWRGLLKAAGMWTADREGVMADRLRFIPYDLRRSFSAHAKQRSGFSVEEASQVLGHDPAVNRQHYGGSVDVERLKEKMCQHPSNDPSLGRTLSYSTATVVKK